jgi:hypothetical protein
MKIILTEYQMDEVVVKSLKLQLKGFKQQRKETMIDSDKAYYERLAKAMKTVLAYYEP